MGSSIRKSLC